MLYEHHPYQRVIGDETTATDRQWLRMLEEAFGPVSHEDLVRSGLETSFATEFLGLVALSEKIAVLQKNAGVPDDEKKIKSGY